jgi:hypothetical protein
MNRREMLQSGFQRLTGLLPAIRNVACELEGWVKGREENLSHDSPTCFPKRGKKQTDPGAKKTTCKEESK